MIANILTNIKPSRTGLENFKVRLALAITVGVLLSLTFVVPVKWLSMFECHFLNLAGFPCPLCGFTRSIWAISAGDWKFATINAPLAWLLYATLVTVFAWNTGCMLLRSPNTFLLRLTRNQANRAAKIAIALILLNWVYRLSLGLT